MTSTPLDQTEAAPDVRDLDASAVLDAVVARSPGCGPGEARLLALAVHWVDLHPVTDAHPAASFPTQRLGGLAAALGPALLRPGPAGRGRDAGGGRVRGRGAVRGLEPVPRGRAGVGVRGGRALLPAPAAVGAGPGRSVAGVEGPPGRPGHHPALGRRRWRSWTGTWPSPAVTTGSRSWGRWSTRPGCGATPTRPPAVEQNALEHRGVWLDHRESTATTLVTARMDTLDALDLDGTVTDLAGLLGRLGDTGTWTSAARRRSGCSRTRNASSTSPPARRPRRPGRT